MKDRFSDWSLYHKAVAAFIAALACGVILRALLVIDTAFEVSDNRTLTASADTLWDLMSSDDERDKWQAELIDLVELTGPTTEAGATRLVFWKRGARRWQSVERTRDVLTGRVLGVLQSSDEDTRWVTMTLQVEGTCQTTLQIEEIIEPAQYLDRFWFFNQRTNHESRLTASLDAMERWATIQDTACSPDKVAQ